MSGGRNSSAFLLAVSAFQHRKEGIHCPEISRRGFAGTNMVGGFHDFLGAPSGSVNVILMKKHNVMLEMSD